MLILKNCYWLMIKLCLVKLVEFNCQFVIIFSIRLLIKKTEKNKVNHKDT